MSQNIIPWQPGVFPIEICDELDRRKTNRSFTYTSAEKGGWSESNGDWKKYKGPTSPWVRFCSNGSGRIYKTDKNGNVILDEKGNQVPLDSTQIKEGFVFFSGKDFYSGYGFNNTDDNLSTIGYVPSKDGGVHTIYNDINTNNYPIHVPAPEIEKINVVIQKELYRRATVEWTCFSKRQLEYMTPYFLVPGISCILEWGWNNYNPASLLDLTDTDNLKKIWNNPYPLYTKNILQSRGNYDVLFGIVTHFEWSIEGNKIKCKTEITSKDRIYAGVLMESTVVNKKDPKDPESEEHPLGNLRKFIDDIVPKFREMGQIKIGEDNSGLRTWLRRFYSFLKEKHKDNWKEYLYGVFYGRDMQDNDSPFGKGRNTDDDFDAKGSKELWINFGLIVEIVNFMSQPLAGIGNKEMFRMDIDDVVISAHPNLMSSDGSVCLIPNAEAPKYFYGTFGVDGGSDKEDKEKKQNEYKSKLGNSSWTVDWGIIRDDKIKKINRQLANYKLHRISSPYGGKIYRDNLDEIINWIRYKNPDKKFEGNKYHFAFPLKNDVTLESGSKPYPARYCGYLKNIYVNTNILTTIFKDESVKTHIQFIEKVLKKVNAACGDFWEFHIVDGIGDSSLKEDEIAPMKIVDNKFMYAANHSQKVYTFDYYDADSLLLGLSFKPTISNAQAIRSIYASTNNPLITNSLTNGNNELLDYHFNDRLKIGETTSDKKYTTHNVNELYKTTMRSLQQVIYKDKSVYQMTNETGETITTTTTEFRTNPAFTINLPGVEIKFPEGPGFDYTRPSTKKGIIVRRLVLPDIDILQLLLDDKDEENNPKYTGIMPGIQATFTIQGIGGLRTFMMFLVRNLPEPYSHMNIVFRIVDVQESVEAGKWTTVITAGIVPLRGYIRDRLMI